MERAVAPIEEEEEEEKEEEEAEEKTNLSARCRSFISFTPRPFYHRKNVSC